MPVFHTSSATDQNTRHRETDHSQSTALGRTSQENGTLAIALAPVLRRARPKHKCQETFQGNLKNLENSVKHQENDIENRFGGRKLVFGGFNLVVEKGT